MSKICTKCKIEKELSEFYFRKDSGKHRNKCKKCFAEQTKDLKYNKFPWRKHFYSARRRCTVPTIKYYNTYGGKGIKFLLTMEEMKELWFRDKAYDMDIPSIDRENSNKNYTFKNCQFMELRENSTKTSRIKKVTQYTLNGVEMETFKSIAEAGRANNILPRLISSAMVSKSNISKGFLWRHIS